ncbi:ARM repeat-containing protein [Tothia fuscella]|uniref:ARM repeat-containing protein n=1 Tax=Tothia fuscella TaxID=1048955 RepID=A0A9P4NIK4_9PEZI|nr:ARM repeat-containing protein [Tothia fuscella]
MATAGSTEERELALINKVEMRIALASTNDKLAGLLKTYLAPLLLKLASEHASVRNKIIAICQHVNTRVKDPSVQLPVAALLGQFKEHKTPLIRHFDLLYVQQGMLRLSTREKADLLPALVSGVAEDISTPNKSGSNLFNLLLQALQHYQLPSKGSPEDEKLRTTLNISFEDGKWLSFWFGKLTLLLTVRRPAAPGSTITQPPPAGLSEEEYQFLTFYGKPDAWDSSKEGGLHLSKTKIIVLRFLATGAFTDDERFLPALFASADTNSVIVERGDDILKKAIGAVDMTDTTLVYRLYKLYLGGEGAAAASPALQMKILSYLTRSTTSTTFSTQFSVILSRGLATGDDNAIKGREGMKLRLAIFAYANYFLRNAKAEDLIPVTRPLLEGLTQYINRQGWPVPETGQDVGLRRMAYELIGLAAKAGSIADLTLLEWFFQSLSEDSSGNETAASIEDGLSSLIGTFSEFTKDGPLTKTDEDVTMSNSGTVGSSMHNKNTRLRALSDLLLRYMAVPPVNDETYHRSTRYVSVRFANRCLPYDNVVGRWINILAIGGPSQEGQEVAEEGKKGLNPYWFKMLNSDRSDLWQKSSGQEGEVAFPSFSELFDMVFPAMIKDGYYDEEDASTAINRFMKDRFTAFTPALNYCHRLFVNNAIQASGGKLDIDADWERKADAAPSTDAQARASIKTYIKTLVESSKAYESAALAGFMRAALEALTWDNGVGIEGCHDIFADMLALCPGEFIRQFGFESSINNLIHSVNSNNEHIRSKAARCFGILFAYQLKDQQSGSASSTASLSKRLMVMGPKISEWEHAVGATINHIHGALKAIAFTWSRLAFCADLESFQERLSPFHETVLRILQESTEKTLLEAAYTFVEQLSIFSVYGKRVKVDATTIESIIDKIAEKGQEGNEKAIIALGRFSVFLDESEDEKSPIRLIDDRIYKMHEIRQMEAQFSVGEALCTLAAGWECTPLQLEIDMDGERPTTSRPTTLTRILKRTIADCRASKPSLRKASVIWLLCFVQFCGHLPEIKEQLRACQAAFKHCLSDRDELVQEASSRGLGLVYEKGDRDLKDDLVRDLVGSFSDNKAQLAGNVTEDTQLFEPGALPTGDGSVTTYKDILSLAVEVGDSSLVYRFMSLAANNSIWTSRAAFGRFGLSNVFSDSSVDGYLSENPKLYPKLYRYRFDPNPNVQRSMNDIWNALVKNSAATIEKHFDAIMDDLLENILTKEWRVRQACCAAIADLVQGRQFATYEKYLSPIWTMCFKVMDDIKNSVRVAAAGLARVLTGILVRNLEAGDGSAKSADGMLKNVLPFLLSTSGLESGAESVQMLSLKTLLEIIKKANARILRPFIPELVERMLGLLSSLENAAVNYIHLNAAKYNVTEGEIDDMRLKSVRASPMMEGVERCLDLLDEESMAMTIIALKNAMKTTIGLPSRVGCSRVLVSLATRHRQLFTPYADQFLKLTEKYVLDRNETISSSYAVSAGYVARLASDEQILEISEFAKTLYCTSEDERQRAVAADIIHAISKHATDRFGNLAVDMLPFVFVAKHDNQEDVAELCEKTWSDNVGGSRAVSLYLKEITILATELLDSPRWNLKHAAARAIADATEALASGVDGIPKDQAELIWPALRKALDGKTWDGKEVVVKAFARFVEKCSDQGLLGKLTPDIVKIILREAKRQNKAYQQAAIPALGKIAQALEKSETLDWYEQTSAIVSTLVEDLTTKDEDAMEIDAGKDKNDDRTRNKLLVVAVEALQRAFNPAKKGEDKDSAKKQTTDFLDLLTKANSVRTGDVYAASFEAVELAFKKMDGPSAKSLETDSSTLEKKILALLFHIDYAALNEAVRLKRAKAILAFASLSWTSLRKAVLETDSRLNKEIAGEKAMVVKRVLEEAKGKIA